MNDPYLAVAGPRSLLCVPLMYRGELTAVLYLENSVCADVFTAEQRQLAILLGHQAAIAMAVADFHKVQIDALQARINPHFLYNALSVIAELVVTNPEAAEGAILKLSKLYRYVLNATADQVVSLEQELSITRDYLAIERHRFGERMLVIEDLRGPLERVQLPALIVQPLVENAVRHGVAQNVGSSTVRIEVEVDEDSCRVRVENDGKGWRESAGSGFGLRSVRERLRLLYGDQHQLRIDNGDRVAVEITLPVQPARVATGVRALSPPLAPAHDRS